MSKMLLRLRGPDGMIRLELEKDETFGVLGQKVQPPSTLLTPLCIAVGCS